MTWRFNQGKCQPAPKGKDMTGREPDAREALADELEALQPDPYSHPDDPKFIAVILMSRSIRDLIVAALRSVPDGAAPCQSPAESVHLTQLVEFLKWAMREGPWDGCDLDGGAVQDKAESLGLIVKTQYDPEKHVLQSGFEDGDEYFVFAPALTDKRPISKQEDGK